MLERRHLFQIQRFCVASMIQTSSYFENKFGFSVSKSDRLNLQLTNDNMWRTKCGYKRFLQLFFPTKKCFETPKVSQLSKEQNYRQDLCKK